MKRLCATIICLVILTLLLAAVCAGCGPPAGSARTERRQSRFKLPRELPAITIAKPRQDEAPAPVEAEEDYSSEEESDSTDVPEAPASVPAWPRDPALEEKIEAMASSERVRGEIFVGFPAGTADEQAAAIFLRHGYAPGTYREIIPDAYVLEFDEGTTDIRDVLRDFLTDPAVRYAEPSGICRAL
ncbi:MAG: hypothetical protein ACYC99_08720 [Candidatus Geothermincolia bacterium]